MGRRGKHQRSVLLDMFAQSNTRLSFAQQLGKLLAALTQRAAGEYASGLPTGTLGVNLNSQHPLSRGSSKLLTLQWAHLSLLLKAARNIRELCAAFARCAHGSQKKVFVMTANHVTPFEAFMSFVEFYPKLSATIAFGTMAAAARMIPTSGAAISDAPQAKGPELVSLANISSPRKRRTAQQSSPRKRSTSHKTPRKISKRATGRRKVA